MLSMFVFTILGVQFRGIQRAKWGEKFETKELDPFVLTSLSNEHLEIMMHDDVTLQVTRSFSKMIGYHLGIFVTHSDGISSEANGIIGMLL